LGRIWLKPTAATLVFLLLWLLLLAAGKIHETRIIGPELLGRVESEGKVDVVVRLSVKPERFHASFFREIAPIGGRVTGDDFFLKNLDREQLARIARPLWVKSVELWWPE
jgi:hypothetical protein